MTVRGYSNIAYPIYLVGALDAVSLTNTISVSATPGGAPADPSGWPSTKPYYIAIDPDTANEEICLVTAVTGSSLDITRAGNLGAAAYGSSTKTHQSGAKIAHVATAADFAEANAHSNATTGVHGLAGGSAVVGTVDTQTLSNKTLAAATAVTGGGTVVGTAGAQTLTNKILSTGTVFAAGSIDSAVTLTAGGQVVSTTATQTLTGKTFTGPQINTPTITGAVFKGGIHFDVRGYGAVGDGSTDDAVAIQAAVTAAAAVGGVVYLGGGLTYGLGDTVWLVSNTQLFIAPGATVKRIANITPFVGASGSGQNIGGYDGQSNIWVGGGGTIDNNCTGQTGSNNCFTFAHGRYITVENITIKDVSGYHGIELNGVKTARIREVRFLGYKDNTGGTAWYKESIQIDISKSAATTSVQPYDNTTCKDVLVSGCTFGPSGTAGTSAPNVALGGHSATVDVHHESIRFVDNYMENLTHWLTVGYSFASGCFSRNEARNCQGGFRLHTIDLSDTEDIKNTATPPVAVPGGQHERQFQISFNNIWNQGGVNPHDASAEHGVYVHGEASTDKELGVVVAFNTIDTIVGSGARGVYATYADRINVIGNVIFAPAGTGIFLDTSRDAVVNNNIVVNAGGTGIFASNMIGLIIQGNRVNNPNDDGIQVATNSSYFTIAINQVLDAGKHGINVNATCADFEVVHNMVRGASKNSAGVSAALRCSNNCSRGTWAGNRTRRSTGTADYLNALSITNSCTLMKRYGNNLQDGVDTSGNAVAGSAISDASTFPDTTATDVAVAA